MPLNMTPTQAAIAYANACAQQERYQEAYLALNDGDHGKRQVAAWLDEARGLAEKLSRECAGKVKCKSSAIVSTVSGREIDDAIMVSGPRKHPNLHSDERKDAVMAMTHQFVFDEKAIKAMNSDKSGVVQNPPCEGEAGG